MNEFGDCVNRLQQQRAEDYPERAFVPPVLCRGASPSGLEFRMSQQCRRHQQQQCRHQREYRRRRQQILVTFDRSLYRTDLELVLL